MDNKQFEYEINFLKNKSDMRLANLNILISKQLSSTSIFMALIVGVGFVCFLNYGFNVFISAFVLFFISWLIPSIKRRQKANREKDRIFKIGSLIKGIYKENLKVNVDRLEEKINKMPSPNKKDIKEHFRKK